MANQQLAEFLAHSLELESEARDRYEELAESMETHHNKDVAALSEGLELPDLKAWDFDWPEAEPPETASYEAVHYRMSLREAMTLALANERAAESFYRGFAGRTDDSETTAVATQFADEEVSHAAELERLIRELPENGHYLRVEDDEPNMPE
jgi:rubrerythrin